MKKFPSAWLLTLGCVPSPPPLDLNPPQVTSIDPGAGATGVATSVGLRACFSRPMQPASATPEAVSLTRSEGSGPGAIPVEVELDPSATCLSIQPDHPLAPLSHYTLVLKKSLLGANGIALAGTRSTDAYTTTFTTGGPPASGVLLVPRDGMLVAPLDLAQVVVAFDSPVTLSGDGGPLILLPGGAPATLSPDGRLAISPFSGADSGAAVTVALAPDLVDSSGQPPTTNGSLWFMFGDCAEGSAPTVGEGVAIARDVDGWLQFATDRPGLCSASLVDPGSPDAGVLVAAAASCKGPYDPCKLSLLCECTLPLSPLGPGDGVLVTPELTGYDGQSGVGPTMSFQTSPPLPPVALTELFPGSKSVSFLELQNRSAGPVDLTGLTATDCGLSLGCQAPKGTPVAFGPPRGVGSATVAAGGYALLVDPTFDATSVPAETLLLVPVEGESMLHLSTSGAQSVGIFLPGAAPVVSLYDGSLLPQTGFSLERVDPGAPGVTPNNWAISAAPGGTPGACNSVTPGAQCLPDQTSP